MAESSSAAVLVIEAYGGLNAESGCVIARLAAKAIASVAAVLGALRIGATKASRKTLVAAIAWVSL